MVTLEDWGVLDIIALAGLLGAGYFGDSLL
jgi:hypothetical protein